MRAQFVDFRGDILSSIGLSPWGWLFGVDVCFYVIALAAIRLVCCRVALPMGDIGLLFFDGRAVVLLFLINRSSLGHKWMVEVKGVLQRSGAFHARPRHVRRLMAMFLFTWFALIQHHDPEPPLGGTVIELIDLRRGMRPLPLVCEAYNVLCIKLDSACADLTPAFTAFV